jgi:hypothetical protein
MGWDSSRSVPWERLVREWVLYAGIMSAIFLVFFRDNNVIGALAGVLISGPLYLAFGAVMAKFGYTRKNLRELRARSKAEASDKTAKQDKKSDDSNVSSTDGGGYKPAPTSRTSSGYNRPKSSSKRKR